MQSVNKSFKNVKQHLKKVYKKSKTIENWRKTVLLACVAALGVDPFFLFVPVIDSPRFCFAFDKTLGAVVSAIRTFIDTFYVVHIIYHFITELIAPRPQVSLRGELIVHHSKAIKKTHFVFHFIVDILSVLPIPQVFGAFWYVSAVEKKNKCWRMACADTPVFALGQNLKTSHSVGDIVFSLIIYVSGLLLFSVLIGNVQLKDRIRRYENYKWRQTRGIKDETLLLGLPKDLRIETKRHLYLNMLHRKKLSYFRIKELKDVLTKPGLSKQGKKQDLVERILTLLSDEQAFRLWFKKNTMSREEVAKLVENTKMKVTGASDVASKGQVSPDTSNLKFKGEPEDSFQPEIKVRCVCGSSLETDSMIQCDDPRCYIWEHVGCVILPEKPMDGTPPLPKSFYCEVCRLTRADPFWVTVAHPLFPVRLTATTIPTDG
ncbi:unnamed protein product [Cochlearia groenlandica]